jgi:hypothetical protein
MSLSRSPATIAGLRLIAVNVRRGGTMAAAFWGRARYRTVRANTAAAAHPRG